MSKIGKLPPPAPASQPRVPTWLPALALAALLSYTLSELASDVWAGEGFALDRVGMGALHGLASPWLTVVMRSERFSTSDVKRHQQCVSWW